MMYYKALNNMYKYFIFEQNVKISMKVENAELEKYKACNRRMLPRHFNCVEKTTGLGKLDFLNTRDRR